MLSKIRLGSRGSQLALKQAEIVKNKLLSIVPTLSIDIITVKTSGDKDQISSLSEIGGKGVFVKELQFALLENKIDIAVHSLKDMTSAPMDNLVVAAYLKPESTRDALIVKDKNKFTPDKSPMIIATGSLRRKLFLKQMWPLTQVVDIRGNIDTRLKKLNDENIDAIVLSEAGLIRLGLQNKILYAFQPQVFYPAPGQGVVALETLNSHTEIKTLCGQINDKNQEIIATMEMTFLQKVGFGCQVPIGTITKLSNERITMKLVYSNEQIDFISKDEISAPVNDRLKAAASLAEKVLHDSNAANRK